MHCWNNFINRLTEARSEFKFVKSARQKSCFVWKTTTRRTNTQLEMASKRKPIRPSPPIAASHLNFRADPGKPEVRGTGTRPTTTPTTGREVFVMLLMHICKKSLFYDINLKVAIYLGSLFIVSLFGDLQPFPRTYFARSDNLFNVYFVKMGWAWTLLLSSPLMFMVSYTVCCGDAKRLVKHHLPRIIIATLFWFFWTKSFNVIENLYGRCKVRGFDNKSSCLKAGHFWNGFDISGHVFILIYSSLVLIEEARPIIGWDTIKEHIRNEEHDRAAGDKSITNPLRFLNDLEIQVLKKLYNQYTPAIQVFFIGCAVLQLLWDVMLVCTMLYYHRMIEKLLSGMIAVGTWYVTYRVLYPAKSVLPDSPGEGVFRYQKFTPSLLKRTPSLVGASSSSASRRNTQSGLNDVPKFMGKPLYGLNQRTAGTPSSSSESTPLVSTDRNNRFASDI